MKQAAARILRFFLPAYRFTIGRVVRKLFFLDLISETGNFKDVTWFGQPLWQNPLDLWTTQQVITQVKPELLIEAGTHLGGSAHFYATLMDLLGRGRVITIDLFYEPEITHERVTFISGSSTDDAVIQRVRTEVQKTQGPVMVILDSDHKRDHVAAELAAYAGFVTPGSYLLVQDSIIDELVPYLRADHPGPLFAIRDFLKEHPEFVCDDSLSEQFLVSNHPHGWLRRRE